MYESFLKKDIRQRLEATNAVQFIQQTKTVLKWNRVCRLCVQLVSGISSDFWWTLGDLWVIAALLLLVCGTMAQRPSCWEYYKEDPETIDQVYFPHESNCRFYYQCSAHGISRMKCQFGMHFDADTHQVRLPATSIHLTIKTFDFFQCGRPDEVNCWFFSFRISSYCCHFF
jgi:hypothetical protein